MTVVIVNHNTCDYLQDCLTSVAAEQPAQILVIDCASTDGSMEMLRKRFSHVTLRLSRDNPGYGGAINQVIKEVTTPFVLLLNSDTRVCSGALAALQEYLDNHPNVGVAGPRLLNLNGALQRSTRRCPGTASWFVDNSLWGPWFRYIPLVRRYLLNAWPHDEPREVPWILGAAMAARKQALFEVGGFDESYFLYFEDIDLCDRLWSAGWQVHFTPAAEIVHVGAAATRRYRAAMKTQYVSSAFQYYRRRYSRRRFLALKRIAQFELTARMIRDWVRLRMARHENERKTVADDLVLWRRLIRQIGATHYASDVASPHLEVPFNPMESRAAGER
jgi:GT2 family glycosyltransferase